MKKKLFIFLLIASFQTKAQTYVLIPDANFVSYLQSIIPSAMNGSSLNITNTLVTTSTQILNVFSQAITNLDGIQYFNSLNNLQCQNNFLTSLPTLPNSLKSLACQNNSLTSLPSLPNTLTYLNCSYNFLSTLPVLSNSLISFICNNNNLINLPVLPNSIEYLYCNNNSLSSLPTLPNSLTDLDCSNNNISCFPPFPKIPALPVSPELLNNINISPNPFNCLPNYLYAMSSTLTAFPLCSAGNTNGCPISSVGIKNNTLNENQIKIYPNPTNGLVNVAYTSYVNSIEIFNLLGEKIYDTKIFEQEFTKEINLTDFKRGFYFIKLSNDYQSFIEKITLN